MVIEQRKPPKEPRLKPILLKSNGVLWDIQMKKPIPCAQGEFDNCQGQCQWFSIDEKNVARCQNSPLGKITPPEKK